MKKMMVWAEVDLGRLRRNLRILRSRLRPWTETLAIVKADAYGHGMRAVARALYGEGVRFFGVASIDEAIELRKLHRSVSILVLGSFHADQLPFYVENKILPTVSSLEDARVVENGLKNSGRLPVHVKIDTGMGRLGVWHEEAEKLFRALRGLRRLEVQGIYTHFANADQGRKSRTRKQLVDFERAVKKIRSLGFSPRYLHAANSMGIVGFGAAHFNLVRPGILLYGVNPSPKIYKLPGLAPILSLKARISFLKKVRKARAISYGSTYRTKKNTWVATLPLGYSHGYRVGLSNRGWVLIRGRKCPVIGRVTMDQTLVDAGAVRSPRRWEEAVLIGESGGLEVTANDLAKLVGTIPYEILCSIHSRIPRIYKD